MTPAELKRLRKDAGLSMREAAEIAHLCIQTIFRWERDLETAHPLKVEGYVARLKKMTEFRNAMRTS